MNIHLLKQSKFRYIILSVVLLISSLFSACITQTPEKTLLNEFNISLIGFDYTIESFNERWCANGDGYQLLVIKFKTLTPQNIAYIKDKCNNKLLPIPEIFHEEMFPRYLSDSILRLQTGYYIYDCENKHTDNFKIFIFDSKNKKVIFYEQAT